MTNLAHKPARLAISKPLLAWLDKDPAWKSVAITTRARLNWQAQWGSTNLALSNRLEAQAAPVELVAPLLIVGMWRSGTTVMHELLASATGCATPLTWQCMDPCAFRLTGSPRGAASSARPMDGLLISAQSPQEDEFALLGLGTTSAYRGFWMPHRLMELAHTLDPQFWLRDSTWMSDWQAFLTGVVRSAASRHQPVILKSPNHTFRLPAILKQYPQTKLVWMIRDPVDIVHSNRKMWAQMCKTHGLTALRVSDLDHFLNVALDRAAQVLDWCYETLHPGQFTIVANEALLADPNYTMRSLWQCANIQLPLREQAMATAIAQTAAGRIDSYPPLPLPQFASAIERLRCAQQRAHTRFRLPQQLKDDRGRVEASAHQSGSSSPEYLTRKAGL